MAKKKINKTQAVQDFLKAKPEATGKEIAEGLKKQGIEITVNYAKNIKSELGKQARSKKPAAKAAPAPKAADAKPAAGKLAAQLANKTQAVKAYLSSHRKAKPLEVVEALAKEGVKVTAAYVASIKSKNKKRKKAVKEVVEQTGIGIPEIKAAISLLKLTDGMAGAKEALVAAQDIMKVV